MTLVLGVCDSGQPPHGCFASHRGPSCLNPRNVADIIEMIKIIYNFEVINYQSKKKNCTNKKNL